MNELLKNMEKGLNVTTTINGDVAYKSTLNKNLDFFYANSSFRYYDEVAIDMFLEAMEEDFVLSIQNLLYLRDINNGVGLRKPFRAILKTLANEYPDMTMELIPYIVDGLGRWDDVLSLIEITPIKDKLIMYVKNVLKKDMENIFNHNPISLLGKWMPSINTSSNETKRLGRLWAKALGISEREYRKFLTTLRQVIGIVENNLRTKDYTFDYSKLPARAIKKYIQAWYRNDEDRFEKYLESLKKDSSVLKEKTKKLYPYEIIDMLYISEDLAEAYWNAIELPKDTRNTIVVRDGSGSMCCGYGSVEPIDVADALTILYSQNLAGAFKDKFITFSAKPQLVTLRGDMTLREKVDKLRGYTDFTHTNIEKVYELLLQSSIGIPKEEQIERIVVVSDMQFDCMSMSRFDYRRQKENVQKTDESVTEEYMKKFEEAGLKLPELVFWNVNQQGFTVPISNLENVKLISGDSSAIMKSIIEDKTPNATDYMVEVLSRYDYVKDIVDKNVKA